MKISFTLILFLTSYVSGYSQILLIDQTHGSFNFYQVKLEAKLKSIHVLNCSGKKYLDTSRKLTSLVTLVNFRKDSDTIITVTKPIKYQGFENYYEEKIFPALKKDLNGDYRFWNWDVFDSVIIYDGSKYILWTGVTEIWHFTLNESKTKITTNFVLNLNSKAVKYSAYHDGIFPVNLDPAVKYKIPFLLRRINKSYLFGIFPEPNEDVAQWFYREFTYKKNLGISAIKSKYLTRSMMFRQSNNTLGDIVASKEYYEFK